MSIAAKHSYRFNYLKSDHWRDLRIQKLASVDTECRRCGKKDHTNDVHHVNYRNLYDVGLMDLMVLCRYCHGEVHTFNASMGGKFLNIEDQTAENWDKFIEFWGTPSKIPELGSILKGLRLAGKFKEICDSRKEMGGDRLVGKISFQVSSRQKAHFERVSKSKNLSLEKWILHLLETHN